MSILDTIVRSKLMRRDPDPAVLGWLDLQPAQSVWITTITLFEARLGMALLPNGRWQDALEAAFADLLTTDLEHRVLSFGTEAAAQAAMLAAEQQRAGRPVDIRDTQIAGIAQARLAAVVSRCVRHSEGFTVAVLKPWG